MAQLIWRPRIRPPHWLVQRLGIWLLTDAVAAMSDPLTAAVGTGDQFAMIALLNISRNADETGSPAPPTGFAQHQAPPRGVSHLIICGQVGMPKNSYPDRRATLGAALMERAAFWYQLLVLKSTFALTFLRLRASLETVRFTTRLAL
jgi:hypothetical protein